MMIKFALSLVVLALISNSSVWAYSELHDEYSLELKGFSPELIDAAESQISRMEGRFPYKPPKKQQLIYNLLNNDWTQSLEPFGSDQIDPPRRPKRL